MVRSRSGREITASCIACARRVQAPEASLLVSTNQTHVISLAVTPQGDLIAGTDSGGLVLRVSPEGKTFALFDTQLREIHALAPAADGSIYALALSDAAATARTPSTPAAPTPQPSDRAASARQSRSPRSTKQACPCRAKLDQHAAAATFRMLAALCFAFCPMVRRTLFGVRRQ